MKKQSITRVFLLSFLILSIVFLALALSPYLLEQKEQGATLAQAEGLPIITTAITTRDKDGLPTVTDGTALRGKYFDVSIVLSNNTLGLTSLDLFLYYDPIVMTLENYGLVTYSTVPNAQGKIKERYVDVLQGADGSDESTANANSALKGLNLNTSAFQNDEVPDRRCLQLLWNGTEADYTNGTIATLRFKSISSSDEKLLGKHYFTMSYRAYNTFRTTPKAEGGHIIYQEVDLQPGYVDITAGKFQCTYFDWNGSQIVHYEENDFSLFVPEEPDHPSRASTRTHYFTYTEDQWSAVNPWTPEMEEPESIKWIITAQYPEHVQPYTIYYYFGEKDPETGVITIDETPEYYYYTLQSDGETKNVCNPKNLNYGDELPILAQYTEAYYSLSPWYLDKACTEELTVGLVPEDTSVDAAMVAASQRGVPLENTFKLNLYAYRQQNEDVITPEDLDVNASKLVNEVIVDGTTVTVNLNLTKNFGIMSMLLTLDYDTTALKLKNVVRGSAFGEDESFSFHYNKDADGYYIGDTFLLPWINTRGNDYSTGIIATLTFTLDPDATLGDHLVTVTYTPKQDVTRYYDRTTIGEGEQPVPAMLWYTTLNVVDGYVTLREVTKPTAHEGNYYFNKTEQTYTFNTNGDYDEYEIAEGTNKRTLHDSQSVIVSLKTGDNVYRFWKVEEGRPRENLTFTFEILKRSVTVPTASSVTYTYNHDDQTYAFDNAGDTGYYSAEASSFHRTLVGKQTIKCVLDYPEETYWGEDEENVSDKEYDFEIVRLRVQRPVSAGVTYVYNTLEQTYQFTDGDVTYYTMAENANKRTVSGSQPVTFTLKDADNYCWDVVGDPTEPYVLYFTIERAAITAPEATTASYVYSKSAQSYIFKSEGQVNKDLYYTVSGNVETAAGNYTVVVALKNTTDTYWAGDPEDVANKEYPFVIQKQTVVAPTASEQSFTFSLSVVENEYIPDLQTYEFKMEDEGSKSLYTVDDAARTKSASGTTQITVSLKDTANYKWNTTGLSSALAYDFIIDKKAVTKPTRNVGFTDSYEYKGSALTFDLIEEYSHKKYYKVENNSRTDAGTYTGEDAVTITLRYPAHCYWAGSDPRSSDTVYYDFVIAPQKVTQPKKHSGLYYYDGTEQTYTFASQIENPSDYYTVSGDKRTLAGHQVVTVALKDKSNYAWRPVGDESVSNKDLSFDFDILPQRVAIPANKKVNGSDKVYVFTGSTIQAEFDRALLNDIYTVTGDQRVSSGEEMITFSLIDKANYCWNDGSTTDKGISFVIRKKVVTAPTGIAQAVEYNGAAQSFVFGNVDPALMGTFYTVTIEDSESEVVEECVNAGVYTYICALAYPDDTFWSTATDDVEPKEFTFTINKKSVAVVSIDPKPYEEQGGEPVLQYSGVVDTEDYTVVDNGGTVAGDYDVVVTLKNANYKWSDNNENLERTFVFTITKVLNTWTTAPSISGWTYEYGVSGTPGTALSEFGEVVITYHAYGSSVYKSELPVDAGFYGAKFEVDGTDSYSGLSKEISFEIKKATLDLTQVAWDYTQSFTYDGSVKTVVVTGLPDEFTERPAVFKVNYTDNKKTEEGSYRAISEIVYDAVNYQPDYGSNTFVDYCDYVIDPCPVTVVWTTAASYEFTGSALTKPTAKYVTVGAEPHDVSLTVTVKDDKAFLASGSYTFLVEIDDHNYVAANGTDSKTIVVAKKAIPAPVASSVTYRFTNAYQTYAFASGFDAVWMTASNNEMKFVGSQFVTVDLLDKTNTYWADTDYSVAPISTYEFVIKKAFVTPPTAHDDDAAPYVYNGNDQTYVFAVEGDSTMFAVENDSRKAHGSQQVSVTLLDTANYCWKDTDEDSSSLEFTFTIAKLAVTAPTADSTAYVYDKLGKTYTFATAGDSAWFTPSGTTRTDAGSQDVRVALNNKADTYWKGTEENTDDITFTFSIAQATVKKPTADTRVFIFDGTEKTYTFGSTEDNELYSLSGQTSKSASGSTTVSVTLNDEKNYCWKDTDGDSSPLAFTFTIQKLAVTAPTADLTAYVYDGAVKTYTFASAGDSAWFTYSGTTRTDAGSQSVTVALKNKADTYWKDTAEKTDDVVFTFVIAKAEATPPTATTKTYVYTGAEITYEFAALGDKSLWSVGSLSRTNAGSEEITVSLVSPSNYRWKGTASSAPLTFTFTVAPAKVAKPAQDLTKYCCSDDEQTYQVVSSPLYTVNGATKKEHGTTDVVISLKDKDNYVWADDTVADLRYPFTIEHDFKYEITTAEYLVGDDDCTLYYKACICGEKSTETYHKGTHKYVVTFDWVKTTTDGVDNYTAAYANVSCSKCKYAERMEADLTVEVIPPGKAKGLKTFIASVELDRVYSDTREVELKAIYHDYGEPVFTWSTDVTGAVTAVATFYCIDEGLEDLKVEVDAVITIKDNEDETYCYLATATFNEKNYSATSENKTKPSWTFIYGDDATDSVSLFVTPGKKNFGDVVPEKPTKEGSIFLKWWEEDQRISLVYTDSNYTILVRETDMVFVALWKSIGQITVNVTDKDAAAMEGCVVELRQGGSDSDPLQIATPDESGLVSFEGLDYGNYSIVVTYTDGTTVTYTTGTVLDHEKDSVKVQMSEKRFNTKVEDEDGKNVTVENLENTVSEEEKQEIVTSGQEGDVAEVTVVLSVVNVNETEEAYDKMNQFVKEQNQNNNVVDIADVTLVKTVTVINENGDEEALPSSTLDSSDELVDITFPITDDIYAALATVHGSVENVVVARADGDSVSFMAKYEESAALASNEECFYVTEKDGVSYIVVRTKTFSTTYGLCVNGSPVGKDNEIISFEVFDWTYGEDKTPATATAKYGTPVISYRLEGTTDWLTFDEIGTAGTYYVKAEVVETTDYKGVIAQKTMTIAKAIYLVDLKFEDLTVVYDGEAHSIVVKGTLPEGVTVNYENNGKAEVGEHVITANFVGNPNYEQIPAMTAILRIVEEAGTKSTSRSRCVWMWILLAIAVVELVLLILLFLRGRKYKKEFEEEREKHASMSALILMGLSRGACLAINIVLLVLDVILLGLLIWCFLSNRSYKKKLKALQEEEKNNQTPVDPEPTPAEESIESTNEQGSDPGSEQASDGAEVLPPTDGSDNG